MMEEIEQLQRAVLSLPPGSPEQRSTARRSLESSLQGDEEGDGVDRHAPVRVGSFGAARTSKVLRAAAVTLLVVITGVAIGLAVTRPQRAHRHSPLVTVNNNGSASGQSGAGRTLVSVSCVRRTACMAVGYYLNQGNAFATWWNGRSWTKTFTAPAGTYLDSVSCRRADFCVAVGHDDNAGASTVEFWNGLRWSPARGLKHGVTLDAVSCTASNFCMAVGNPRAAAPPRAEEWNGTTWRLLSTPGRAADGDILKALVCRSPDSCVAVGNRGFDNRVRTLTETWNGSDWRIVSSANVRAASSDVLNGISCSSTSDCLAVGSYQPSGPALGLAPLAEFWNGRTWSRAKPMKPAGATLSLLNGISGNCSIYCMTVGEYFADGHARALAESWNAHRDRWTIRPAADAPDGAENALEAVACENSIACIAVGYFDTATPRDNSSSLAETWNGAAWQIRSRR